MQPGGLREVRGFPSHPREWFGVQLGIVVILGVPKAISAPDFIVLIVKAFLVFFGRTVKKIDSSDENGR